MDKFKVPNWITKRDINKNFQELIDYIETLKNKPINLPNEFDLTNSDSTKVYCADSRLIDAEQVKSAIKNLCDKYNISYGTGHGGFGDEIANLVDSLPIKDCNNKSFNFWRTFYTTSSVKYRCNNCKSLSSYNYNYCPCCGVHMNRTVVDNHIRKED